MNILDHAKKYAERGWPVIPLRPKEKVPLTAHGLKDASVELGVLEGWWAKNPDANIGIVTGEVAGIWVLDIDGEIGSVSLLKTELELGPLPETLEQKTGGNGRQLFFAWPKGREIRNKQALRTKIDVRGNGGYVVAPPSIHPNGQAYDWPYGDKTKIKEAPEAWIAALETVAKPKVAEALWEPPQARKPVVTSPGMKAGIQVVERARLYLQQCEAAVQGKGGHDKLLWAARAMVVGFELDDATALSLLWSDYNPKCLPPWDKSNKKDVREFDHKVDQARTSTSTKQSGWALDEFGLRDSAEAMANITAGRESARNLLGLEIKQTPREKAENIDQTGLTGERKPFPVDLFPEPIANYCSQVAQAHVVDTSFCALPILCAAGTAMGNAFRLKLKKGFNVNPVLWVGLVAPSGTNKSGPLNEIIEPLRGRVPIDENDVSTCNPQGRMMISDATTEAVIVRMYESPRGLMVFRDELAGWCKGFNAYKKSGGDEQAWLEFWGAKEYVLDRKTNNEQIHIPAAACSILGGIQPSVLVECFDPGRFASGLVPRILIACPPAMDMFWSEAEVDAVDEKTWYDAIMWLRTRPFESFNLDSQRYMPHVLNLTRDAKEMYVGFFNVISLEISGSSDEALKAMASKSRIMAGRLALIHHGLKIACAKESHANIPVDVDSMDAGIEWARWCLDEQTRVYGFAGHEHRKEQAEYLAGLIQTKGKRNSVTIRQTQRLNARRYKNNDIAKAALDQLVEMGYATWNDEGEKVTLV